MPLRPKYPEFESDLKAVVKKRHAMGLVRSKKIVRRKGLQIAKSQHGLMDFKCSDGYLRRFAKRQKLKLSPKTTSKQQTIFSYLEKWNDWIIGIRTMAVEIKIVTNGYINGGDILNLDEFAIMLGSRGSSTRHFAPTDAIMINVQDLLTTRSNYHRWASVASFFPMTGFKKGMCFLHLNPAALFIP